MRKGIIIPKINEILERSLELCVHCKSGLEFIDSATGEKAGVAVHALSKEQFLNLYYARCTGCGTVFFLNTQNKKYEDAYFDTEYRAQYGRSYSEDKDAIMRLNEKRARWLANYIPRHTRRQKRVLEIGCALGYFLETLQKEGYADITGIDISKFAVENASGRDTIDYRQVSFDDFIQSFRTKRRPRFDLIAAFFVIEHMPNQKKVLQGIADLLNPGGHFIFAVPSTNGPLFEFHRRKWFETHPGDHFADYSPEALEKILPHYGLRAIDFRVPTFHLDRADGAYGILQSLGDFGQRTYQFLAQLNRYADTIECIAKKE